MVVADTPSPLGEPALSLWQLPHEVSAWLLPLAAVLDARQRDRLADLVCGLLLARGRRTVTSWLRAAGLGTDFRACYRLVYRVGRRAERLAEELLLRAVLPVLTGSHDRLLFGLDDTPTRRYGP